MVRAVKLTLVGVQSRQLAEESPAAGTRLPFFGQARIPEAIGVFTADLSGKFPLQWTVQAAHIRNLLDLEVASGTYDMEVWNMKPVEKIAMLFNFGLSKEKGGGTSVFSRAVAQLEYAATSALNIAQRSASWLTRNAIKITEEWKMRLDEDDTLMISHIMLFELFGGLSTGVTVNCVGGKVGFAHGGLDFLFFVADPAQPLDGNLRATLVRIASAKTRGEFDRHRPFVASMTWGSGNFQCFCKNLTLDITGKKCSSVEDISQRFETLKLSLGGGHLSDGSFAICLGQSDV